MTFWRSATVSMLIAFGWSFGVAPGMAQTDATACAAIAADPERLACYDAIFRQPGTNVPAPLELVLESTQAIPARPSGREPATMTVSCEAGELSVRFAFARQLLSETSDDAAISFQVAQGGSFVRSLPVSPDNTTIGFGTSREAEGFLEALEGGGDLTVRITPVRQRSIQVRFNVRQREPEIAALRAACAS